MKKGPFKMKGNPMKRNFGLPTDNMASPMMKKPDPNAYEKMLQADKNAGKTLTPQQEKILGKYKSRMAKKSPARQEKKRMMTSEFRKKKKGNIPFPNLKDHGDGTYSYTTPDGKTTLTKSEYTSAKASNKEYGY